ncbi:MAG: chemotaxis protein CheW [Xanthomonadaceae bacterium]|jgi:chemosensory pili system protein ChpC|nr:chemotaxis protein CheW [Xanthomonadaceae bacterium]
MSYHNDEVRGVVIQAGIERLLLPNATIGEVLSKVPVEAIPNTPGWLVGQIDWQGWKVPLIAFASLSGLGEELSIGHNKIVVLKALGGNERLPYFAIQTAVFPQLVSVPRDGLLADAAEGELPEVVRMRVLLGKRSTLLPDLDAVERKVMEALDAVNWNDSGSQGGPRA